MNSRYCLVVESYNMCKIFVSILFHFGREVESSNMCLFVSVLFHVGCVSRVCSYCNARISFLLGLRVVHWGHLSVPTSHTSINGHLSCWSQNLLLPIILSCIVVSTSALVPSASCFKNHNTYLYHYKYTRVLGGIFPFHMKFIYISLSNSL